MQNIKVCLFQFVFIQNKSLYESLSSTAFTCGTTVKNLSCSLYVSLCMVTCNMLHMYRVLQLLKLQP